MAACCCSLVGTNACITCSNGCAYHGLDPKSYLPSWLNQEHRTRIIEKFDKDGKLIERITES